MAGSQSEFVGLKEANAALKRLPDFARDEVQAVMDVTAFQVAQGAIARAPDGATGRLKESIRSRSRPKALDAVVGLEKGLITYPFYWKFLEYGTVKMPARPMFRPAALAVESDHEGRLTRALEKAASTMARSAGSPGSRLV